MTLNRHHKIAWFISGEARLNDNRDQTTPSPQNGQMGLSLMSDRRCRASKRAATPFQLPCHHWLYTQEQHSYEVRHMDVESETVGAAESLSSDRTPSVVLRLGE